MKKLFYLVCAACLWGACGESDNEKAQAYLDAAEASWQAGDFNAAKMQIDSVKLLFPKAFEARKAGVKLMKKVELDEQRQTLTYLDSVLQAKQAVLDSMKSAYVLEKDAEYQKVGNYFVPSQTVEKSLHRTFLRAQVSEKGQMSITSFYCGSSNIHHTAVRVSSGDAFAETPKASDVYESSDLGWRIEQADFPLAKDGGVSAFIAMNRNANIQLKFLGERDYQMVMSAADKNAVADIYALAQVLSSIEQVKQEQQEANRKIQFITKKLKEAEAE